MLPLSVDKSISSVSSTTNVDAIFPFLGELITVNVPKPINKIIAILINVIIPIKKDFIVLTDTSVFF